ncbi:MFS transporter [Maribrevibacterium harenarium]|uniref:MFS transporter n=1 Tax=Maribrevibacterium harenarium TaxID=2589817 RepID=A0A501X5E4_9GAMM|nr:MFS transporter [Maribrevibacterium harenarium]TPE55704.1 MFS transporter [Maribrevibacterium harenarium]
MFSKASAPVAWPLFFYFFFFCSVIGVLMPYMSVYYQSIGLTGSEIGRLMSSFTLAAIVVPHFWGWLTTKTGRPKRTLQIAAFGCGLALLPFVWVGEFIWLWLLSITVALFYSALTPMGDALAVRSTRHLDVPYSRVRVGGSIGYIFSVTIFGALIGWFGPSTIIYAVIGCVWMTFIATFFLKEQTSQSASVQVKGQFLKLLRQRQFVIFLALAFLSYMSHAPFNTFFAVHLLNAGYSNDVVGLLIAFGVILEIVLFIFLGNYVKRVNRQYLFALCFICGGLRWVSIGWFAEIFWVVLATQLLHCITFALFHVVSIEQLKDLVPDQYVSQGQAAYSGISAGLGSGLGIVGAGYLWDWFGGGWTFTAASLVCGLALVILLLNQFSRGSAIRVQTH